MPGFVCVARLRGRDYAAECCVGLTECICQDEAVSRRITFDGAEAGGWQKGERLPERKEETSLVSHTRV